MNKFKEPPPMKKAAPRLRQLPLTITSFITCNRVYQIGAGQERILCPRQL